MKVEKTNLKGLLVIHPDVFTDERGYFLETFSQKAFNELTGCADPFVQDNESFSNQHVLRGLHYQLPPHEQSKLVRVAVGRVLDVAVDLRKSSATFGQHFSIELTGDNKIQLFIPTGFAHGFLTLSESALFVYKCSQYYQRESERSLHWNDPQLAIDWGISQPIVSAKDHAAPLLKDCEYFS